jgi:GH24 family phage-related lysozyme (muramidase)
MAVVSFLFRFGPMAIFDNGVFRKIAKNDWEYGDYM